MSIPQSFLQELLARTDVVEVVGRYVQLKKSGANFMGLCPFHGEKSPSFSVSPAKQFYHCFGCGANGNAISFLIEQGGLTFIEAVQDLAQQAGLTVPDDQASPRDKEQAQRQREHQTSLTDLLALAAKAYARQLKTSPRAVAYLKGRGLTGEIARQYGLGYAPEGWRPLASLLPDYADARLVEAGLVIAPDDAPTDTSDHATDTGTRGGAKRYDRFRDRIMFPIRNVKGDTIGFGGRVLDKDEPKYLNSPETPVFSKGRELYGLFEARTAIREKQYALVTEGYMDVVALAQLGFGNAVATLGTACTPDHIQKLLRFTDNVIFSFDGDAAGRRAAAKAMHAALPHATDTRSIRFLFLPPEHDPDSFIREQGPQAFEQCVQQAVPLSRFLSDTAKTGCDLVTPEGRAHMASNARALWQALPECAYKRQILADLAQQIGLSANELLDVWQLQSPPHQNSDFHSYQVNKNKRRAPENPSISDGDAFDTAFPDPEPDGQDWQDRQDWRERPLPPPTSASYRAFKAGSSSGSKGAPGTGAQGWRRDGKFGNRWRSQPPVQREPLPQLQSRAELVARILLTYPQAWDWLTPDDHHLLAEQPAPIGALLMWMESQWHENGPQPWAVLQQAMAHEPFAPLAQSLMSQALTLGSADDDTLEPGNLLEDTRRELQELTLRMQVDHLTTLEKLALADASRNPQALERYRLLHERRKALLVLLNKPAKL